jgi:UDP:flavonoid glycosyltransferase YjiC (YdhE family)
MSWPTNRSRSGCVATSSVSSATADNLAGAIRKALAEPSFLAEAGRLGALVGQEDGVGAAVTALERIGAGQLVSE